MINTVNQACLFNPIIGEYMVTSRTERIAEQAKQSEMGSAVKALDACLNRQLFGK